MQLAATYKAMNLDQLSAYLRETVLPQTMQWTLAYRDIASRYGVHLVAYEGGQHMIGYQGGENDAALNQRFDAFNRDPRIKAIYLEYLDGWRRSGGELFMHFADVGPYTKWGRWGALEFLGQPREAAPKYDALQTFIERNPVR